VLAALAFIFAPFTWSYLGTAGGYLIRIVDVVFILLILTFLVRLKLKQLPYFLAFLLFLIIILNLIRSIFYSDISALASAVKIFYYLLSSIILSSVLRDMLQKPKANTPIIASLIAIPFYYKFFVAMLGAIALISSNPSLVSMSTAIFRLWAEVFAQNAFGSSEDLAARGISFRNSAGIGFLVLSMFYYVWEGRLNQFLCISFFIVAALLFSRSVWLIQIIFLILLLTQLKGRKLFTALLALGSLSSILILNSRIIIAIVDRINSDFGRSEMISIALTELNQAVIFGRTQGALLTLSDGVNKNIHNVPLAYGLEVGILGLSVALLISMTFLYMAVFSFSQLMLRKSKSPKKLITKVVLSSILFIRPLLSASFDIYFSIGEWCALSLLLALSTTNIKFKKPDRYLRK
jgi:hypothetical protein